MTLLQVQCFIAVADTLSFTKAAEILFSSQSTVSQHINALESELGFPLLARSNKSVRLTPEGRVFLQECKLGTAHLETAVKKAIQINRGFEGSLRIGCIPPIDAEPYFSASLRLYKQTYQNIEVVLEQSSAEMLLTKLESSDLDVLFTIAFTISNRADLTAKTLRKGQKILIMAKDHPLANAAEILPQELGAEQFIGVHPRFGGFTGLKRVCDEWGIDPDVLFVPNIDTLLLYVKMGIGIAVVDDNLRNISQALYAKRELPFCAWEDGMNHLIVAWNPGNNNPTLPLYLEILSHQADRINQR